MRRPRWTFGCTVLLVGLLGATGAGAAAPPSVPATASPCIPMALARYDFEDPSTFQSLILSQGAAGVDDWQGAVACAPASSGTQVLRFGGAADCAASYRDGQVVVSHAPWIPIPLGSTGVRMSFVHRRDFENGPDGGTVAMALDGGNMFFMGPASAVTGDPYNGNLAADPARGCPLNAWSGLVSAFTGTQAALTPVAVDLDAMCNQATVSTTGCSGHAVQPGFLMFTDCAQGGAGWFIDDVVITACVPTPPGTDFHTLAPCRLLDTRDPAGPQGGPALQPNAERLVTAARTCGISATARALAVNVTAVQPPAGGMLQIGPAALASDSPAILSLQPGRTRATQAVAALAFDLTGTFRIRSTAASPVDVVIDVTGYFE